MCNLFQHRLASTPACHSFGVMLALSSAVLCPPSVAAKSVIVERSPAIAFSARHDRASGIVFIGAQPENQTVDAFAQIEISRAADIVGRPLQLVRHNKVTAPSLGTGGGLGAGFPPSRMPLRSGALTSGFGIRDHPILGQRILHAGVDLAASVGTPIAATADGIVTKADWVGGYGLMVMLAHSSGLQTRYGHMSRLNVREGQYVTAGETIGFVGSTGRSTGPHLHYEVRINGRAVNPLSLIGTSRR